MRVIETCISKDENVMEENILEIFELPVLKSWARVKKGSRVLKPVVYQTTGVIHEYSYFCKDKRRHLKYPAAIYTKSQKNLIKLS